MIEKFQPNLEKKEDFGKNITVENYWNRHSQKQSAEGFNPNTGEISNSSISQKGQKDSIKFGKGIKASKHGILQTYVSSIERTTETAESIIKGYKESNPTAAIRDISVNERLTAPGGEYPEDFFDLYAEKFSKNKTKIMKEKGIDPTTFDDLSSDKQAKIAEAAEEPVIKEWLQKESELNKLLNPKVAAKDFGRLFYFHSIRIPSLLHSNSEIDLLHVSHHAIMEPFLASGVLIRDRDNKKITDLKELGGSLQLLEGWKSTTNIDNNGKLSLKIEIRGESYSVDMDKLKQMGQPGKTNF